MKRTTPEEERIMFEGERKQKKTITEGGEKTVACVKFPDPRGKGLEKVPGGM